VGREPSIEETARAADCTIEEARRVLAMSRYPISLDRPVGNSEDSHFGDLLPDRVLRAQQSAQPRKCFRGQISKVLRRSAIVIPALLPSSPPPRRTRFP